MQSAHRHMSNSSHGAWLPMILQISFDNINDSLPASLSPLQHCRPAPSLSHSETMQMKHGSRSTCNISYYSIYTMKKWIKLAHIKPCIHVRKDIHGEITHLPMWLKCRACHLASMAISTHTQAPQSHHASMHMGVCRSTIHSHVNIHDPYQMVPTLPVWNPVAALQECNMSVCINTIYSYVNIYDTSQVI